jgi:hypothetical protein
MSTRLGYIVDSMTGESIAAEDCFVVSPPGRRSTVISKINGRNMSDPHWVFVPGEDGTSPEVMSHPSFRLKMMLAAADRGVDTKNLFGLLFGEEDHETKEKQ